MHAATVWRPWDQPLAVGAKPIENRPKPPPRKLLGEVIAIHAGKHYDYDGAEAIKRRGFVLDPWAPGMAVVGVARIAGWLDRRPEKIVDGEGLIASATALDPAVARAQFERLQKLDTEEWWMGPVGILLVDAVAIRPVPCRGAQGWWTVPADIEAKVRGRVAAARAA